jgi:hypothetical protein
MQDFAQAFSLAFQLVLNMDAELAEIIRCRCASA